MHRPEIDPDERTDEVGDGGRYELEPPTDEEIAAGVEHDRSLRQTLIADPSTPFQENPTDDRYDQ